MAKCLQVMEDALERFPGSPEVLLFFAEVSAEYIIETMAESHYCIMLPNQITTIVWSALL